jgi:hypothetical protein
MRLHQPLNCLAALALLTIGVSAVPAAELCKWVDENGTVHYAETCPDTVESDSVNVDVDDPANQGDDPYADSRARLEQRGAAAGAAAQDPAQPLGAPLGQQRDYTGMSPAQLASECERQREAILGPERQQLIARCKAEGQKSASACERFYADWGNGGVRGGHTVGRKYDNLPACVAARGGGQ